MFEPVIAPSHTLVGLLQRGRGDGTLHALAADRTETRAALEACVTRDPRRDWQAESRSLYYARLFLELEVDLASLRTHLFHPDDLLDDAEERTGLTLSVLGRLAGYGRRDALELLRDYAAHGANLGWALDELALRDDDAALAALAPAVLARYPAGEEGDADLAAAVRGCYEQHPWRLWAADHPRVARALEQTAVRRWDRQLTPRGPLPGWGAADILAWADRPDASPTPAPGAAAARCLLPVARPEDRPLLIEAARGGAGHGIGARCAALRHLAARSDEAVFGLIRLAADDGGTAAETALACLRGMRGPAALDHARSWVRTGDPAGRDGLTAAAAAVLARCGDEPADADAVARVLHDVQAVRGPDEGSLQPLVEGVARLGAGAGAVPALRTVYAETSASQLRGAAARALAEVDPAFAEGSAVECLWDCEEGTRELGARHAAIGDVRVLRRLRNLAADPAEEQEVHEAARGRLTAKPRPGR